jgi:hypothetical protein
VKPFFQLKLRTVLSMCTLCSQIVTAYCTSYTCIHIMHARDYECIYTKNFCMCPPMISYRVLARLFLFQPRPVHLPELRNLSRADVERQHFGPLVGHPGITFVCQDSDCPFSMRLHSPCYRQQCYSAHNHCMFFGNLDKAGSSDLKECSCIFNLIT